MNQAFQKYYYLDAIRGLLALIVFVHHFILLFNPIIFVGSYNLEPFRDQPYSLKIILANSPLSIFMNGNWAVCMFFILSGFVLSFKYHQTQNAFYLQVASIKRYFRLIIPILASCLLVYLFHLVGLFKMIYYPRNIEAFSFGKELFKNNLNFFETIKIALFDVPFFGNNTILPVLWTMKNEFLFALVLFAFLLITHGFEKKWIYFILIIVLSFCLNLNYLTLFFAGSFIACYLNEINQFFKKRYLKFIVLFIGLFLAGIPSISDNAKAYTMYAFTVGTSKQIVLYFHLLSVLFIFLVLTSSGTIQNILRFKVLQFFGEISFSLYLVHLPILFITGSYLITQTNGTINLYFLFLICLIACILISFLFYKLIDNKAIRISQAIANAATKPKNFV